MLSISAWGMVIAFALIVLIPPVGRILGMTTLGMEHWFLAIALSIVPTIIAEFGKSMDSRRDRKEYKGRLVRHTPKHI